MHAKRNRAQSRYLDLLMTVVEAYERAQFKVRGATPLEALQELMAARGMKQADLAKLTGSSGTASEIYHGKRGISVGLARKLAQHLNVPVTVFL